MLLLGACGGHAPSAVGRKAVAADWRVVATEADRDRLRRWREAWTAGLAKARASGSGAQIDAQGALFEPDRAMTDALPPPGDYHCRVFKLGAKGTAMADFTAYPFFDCRIAAEGEGGDAVSSFFKVDGSQRPVGLIFKDGTSRRVFLGTLVLGDETRALEYGADSNRDMAGLVERVGPKRWRLVLPYPRYESLIDVMELVPAG
ncbi:hypothetical protein BH09PSE4_BH09PSE4_21170 [soil metagenome]